MPTDDVRVKIDGREYPVPDRWTLGEQALFKTIAGVRMMELDEAMRAGDPQALMALFLIVKRRAGEKATVEDVERVTDFEFIGEVVEGDAVPPPVPATVSPPSEPSVIGHLPSSATSPDVSGPLSSRTASA